MRGRKKFTPKHNLNKLNLASYIPADSTQVFKKQGSIKFVTYGTKNDYPQYLKDLSESSPTHGTLLKSKARMVYGNGLVAKDDSGIKIARLALNKELRLGVKDNETYGGFYWEILRDSGEIGMINHIPFEFIRSGEKEDGEITEYFHNENWNKPREAVSVPAYEEDSTEQRSILFVGELNGHYPIPFYKSAINYIELEKALSYYFVMHVKNGLHPGFMIVFKNGKPEPHMEAKMKAQIEATLMGEENTNKFFMVFTEEGEETPEFISLDIPDPSDQYTFLNETAPEKIMIAHAVVSPMLFGLKNSTGFGNNAEELDTAKELFEETYIEPSRSLILEGLNPLMGELGIAADFQGVTVDDSANVDKSFTGIQISSAVQVMQSVSQGLLTARQAVTILVNMLGFTPEDANALFPETRESLDLMTTIQETDWIDRLKDKGEKVSDDWELREESECTNHEREAQIREDIERQLNLASISDANAEEKSDWGDSGLYKLRYVYKRRKPSESGKTRPFCETMEALGAQDIVFWYEDIALGSEGSFSEDGENGQFAPKGDSKYDIFEHKGGVNCHHYWARRIYFRKRDANGKFLPRSTDQGLENDKRVANVPFVPQKGDESIAPIDTASKGRLNFKQELKKWFNGNR